MDVSKSVAFPRMGVSMNILFHPISWLRLKLAPESESAPLRPWGDQHSNHWPRIQSHRTLQQHSLRSSTPTVKNPLASTHPRARKEGKVTKKKYQMRDARGNTKLSCSPSERITRWEDARRMLAQAVNPRQREPEKNRSTSKKRSTATLIMRQHADIEPVLLEVGCFQILPVKRLKGYWIDLHNSLFPTKHQRQLCLHCKSRRLRHGRLRHITSPAIKLPAIWLPAHQQAACHWCNLMSSFGHLEPVRVPNSRSLHAMWSVLDELQECCVSAI